MKLYIYLFLSLFISTGALAQGKLKLTLEWNNTSNQYEVFAISSVSNADYFLGQSNISVVLPNTAPVQSLLISSHAGGEWQDAHLVDSPEGVPDSQYHLITSNGGNMNMVANQPRLLFSFKIADDQCRDGVRLYNNGSDPGENAKGFENMNFNNSIKGVNDSELYWTNVSNSGSKCLECPVNFVLPKLKKLSN